MDELTTSRATSHGPADATALDLEPASASDTAGPSRLEQFTIPPRPDIDMARLVAHRLARIRDELRAADCAFAILHNPVSLRYAVDWREYQLFQSRLPTYYLFVPVDGPVVMHGAYGGKCAAIDDYRPAHYLNVFDAGFDIERTAKALTDDVVAYARDLGFTGALPRIAVERLNPAPMFSLREAGFSLTDGEVTMERARSKKSPDEVACMRYAIAVAEHGMARMETAMQPGMSENALFGLLHETNIRYDGEWIDGRMLCSGPRTNPWYQQASDRTIEAGDLVAFDTDMIGPYGYCADISRTWLCGDDQPSVAQRDVYRRAYDEVQHNSDLIRAGMTFKEISDRAFRQPEEYVDHRYACLAHGVGMTDEYPKIYYREDWAQHGYDGVLEPGTILCVESFVGHRDGGPGVKLEEVVEVGAHGCEPLSTYPFDDRLLGSGEI